MDSHVKTSELKNPAKSRVYSAETARITHYNTYQTQRDELSY